MSILDRNTFRDDGYKDGREGRRPNPPDPHDGSDIFRKEYMEGWEQGNHEHAIEQCYGPHGQG